MNQLRQFLAIAGFALAAALFAIPADEARADVSATATFHAEAYPLHRAVIGVKVDAINHFLTEHAVSVDMKDNMNLTPLHHVAGASSSEPLKIGNNRVLMVATLIAEGAKLNLKDGDGNTPLHYAVQFGHVAVVDALIAADEKVSLNVADAFGFTPLHWAVGNVTIVDSLIEADANVTLKDDDGKTPLHHAAAGGSYDVVVGLLAADADVNAQDNSGSTPLHNAAKNGHPDVVAVLLAEDAVVNLKDKDGKTPLHLAVDGDHSSVVRSLILLGGRYGKACANGFVVNPAGDSPPCVCPANMTAANGTCEIAAVCTAPLILDTTTNQCGCPVGYDVVNDECVCPPEHGVLADGTCGACPARQFVQGGVCAAPDAQSCEGLTPAKFYDSATDACVALAECAAPSVLNTVTNLCDCPAPNIGADGAAAPGDCHGENALHAAAGAGDLVAVNYLITAHMADVNATVSGETPLHAAAGNGHVSVVLTLIAKKAEVNATDSDGLTPLRWAAFRDHAAVVAALIAEGGHYGEACMNLAVVNPAGPDPSCVCESPNVGTPEDCAAPDADSCKGLTPAKFYDSAADACVALAECAAPSVLNTVTNLCDCPAPNIGADGAAAPGDCHGENALHAAAGAGDLVSVNYLIAAHMADVNATVSGETPLHAAAGNGHVSVVLTLIAEGATVNAKSGNIRTPGWTPLHYAAGNGHVSVVLTLIAKKAEVNATDNDDLTPLRWAAFQNHAAVVAALIAAGGHYGEACMNLAVVNPAGPDPSCVCESPNVGTPEDCAAPDADSCKGLTPAKFYDSAADACVALAECAAPSVLNTVTNQCDCPAPNIGADGEAAPGDCHGENALHVAAGAGDLVSVNYLITAHMADVNATVSGETPLHVAAGNGHVSVVLTLIEKKAEVNATDSDDLTPLHWAAFQDHAAVVAALIAAGGHYGEACASPAVVNPAGPDPSCVCESPNVGTPGACAAPGAQSCKGLTPAKFYDSAADACVALAECAAPSVLNTVTNLCDCPAPNIGADGEAAPGDCHGENALHAAAGAGDLVSVNYLIAAHMADVNATVSGETPLHVAAGNGHVSVVLTLIAEGATVNAKSGNIRTPGWTPLHYAAGYGHVSVVLTLIEKNAEVNATDNDGLTPLRWADVRHRIARAAATGGGLTSLQGADVRKYSAVVAALLAAGGHYGEACMNPAVVNPAGPVPSCVCASPNVGTPEDCAAPDADSCKRLMPSMFYDSAAVECVAFAECAAPSVLNTVTNLCDCPAPNIGTGAAAAPGKCAAPGADSCGGLTPPAFYSPTLSACAPYDECLAAGDCVLSAAACARGFSPEQFYDSAAGACAAVAECAAPAVLNTGTNRCDCPAPNIGLDGADAPGSCLAAENALYTAAEAGDLVSVNFLITAHMADVNATVSGVGETPLHVAAGNGHVSVVLTLLAEGATVNAKSGNVRTPGWTPLHYAVDNGHISVVLTLLAKKAEVNATDNDGLTPLRWAAFRDHAAVVAALIAEGGHYGAPCANPAVVNPAGPDPSCACPFPNVDRNGVCFPESGDLDDLEDLRDGGVSDKMLCGGFGGTVQTATGGEKVCSGMDANGTFCIIDSTAGFPCQGLFKHLWTCNVKHNRPALNPFFCGPECGAQEKAVGKLCVDS